MNTPLQDALNLVDFGPCRGHNRSQDWIGVAAPMTKHCTSRVEDINLAAARIIADELKRAWKILEKIERISDDEDEDVWTGIEAVNRIAGNYLKEVNP
jgi:hypothetical protein